MAEERQEMVVSKIVRPSSSSNVKVEEILKKEFCHCAQSFSFKHYLILILLKDSAVFEAAIHFSISLPQISNHLPNWLKLGPKPKIEACILQPCKNLDN